MASIERAWAMRTSRNNEAHRIYIQNELSNGRLRQGWGGLPEQDLRLVKSKIEDTSIGWVGISQDQKWAWGHWRMLGEMASDTNNAILNGDIILIPNSPTDSHFTLCYITGPYDFKIDSDLEDFGHIRSVEILTPGGVSYTHPLVSAGLRRSLRCRSRLWWIGDHLPCLSQIIAKAAAGENADLREGTDHILRAKLNIARPLEDSLNILTKAVEGPLKATLHSAEWEPVICAALRPLLNHVEIVHTGGPNERGADIEILIPNPFEPKQPWIIAVQVKDYVGQIGIAVISQIEQAIQSRMGLNAQGRLLAVVLASINASPSAELTEALEKLSKKYGVSASCVYGDGLMRAIARGLFTGFREGSGGDLFGS